MLRYQLYQELSQAYTWKRYEKVEEVNNYYYKLSINENILMHLDLYISDLEDLDPELSKNLLWVLKNDVSGLGTTF